VASSETQSTDMKQDTRESSLYREAEALYKSLRRPGTGQISDAAEIMSRRMGLALPTERHECLDDRLPPCGNRLADRRVGANGRLPDPELIERGRLVIPLVDAVPDAADRLTRGAVYATEVSLFRPMPVTSCCKRRRNDRQQAAARW
jgi:hypothetical protein